MQFQTGKLSLQTGLILYLAEPIYIFLLFLFYWVVASWRTKPLKGEDSFLGGKGYMHFIV